MRQGPHQVAQKSTSTGTRAFSMISLNNSGSTSSGSAAGLSGVLQALQRPYLQDARRGCGSGARMSRRLEGRA